MTKVLNEDLESGIKFLFDTFTNYDFDTASFNKVKKIVLAEHKRRIEIPEKLIGISGYKLLYKNQRPEKPNTGSDSDIKALSVSKCLKFKKRLYLPKNFVLVISGNFDENRAFETIESYFGKLRTTGFTGNKLRRSKRERFLIQNGDFLVQAKNINSLFHVKIDYYAPLLSSFERIYTSVLAKYIENRLITELRIKKGICYNVSCSSYSSANFGIFGVYCCCEENNAPEMLKLLSSLLKSGSMRNQKSNIKKSGGVSLNSLRNIKKQMYTDFVFDFEKVSGRAEYYSEAMLGTAINKVPLKTRLIITPRGA